MSRKETDEEFEARMQAEHAKLTKQDNCYHFDCKPVSWYWSGQIREMLCSDCGKVDHREEVESK